MLQTFLQIGSRVQWMLPSENRPSSFVTGHHPPERTANANNWLFLLALFWLPLSVLKFHALLASFSDPDQ